MSTDNTVATITKAIEKLQDALAKHATDKKASRADLAEASALIKSLLGSHDKGNDPENHRLP